MVPFVRGMKIHEAGEAVSLTFDAGSAAFLPL